MIEMLCIFLFMIAVVEGILLYGMVKQSRIERRLIVRLLKEANGSYDNS